MKRIWILLAVTVLSIRTQANEVLLSPDGQTQIGFQQGSIHGATY